MSSTPRNKKGRKSTGARTPGSLSPSPYPRFAPGSPSSPTPLAVQSPAPTELQTAFAVSPSPPPSSANARPHHLRVLVNVADAAEHGWRAGEEVWVEQWRESKVMSGMSCAKAIGIVWPSMTVPRQTIQLGAVLRQSANLELEAKARLTVVAAPVAEAHRISLRPSATTSFPIDDMLSIYAKEMLVDLKYVVQGNNVEFHYYGKLRQFTIESVRLEGDNGQHVSSVPCRISRRTQVSILPFQQADPVEDLRPNISYDSIGGLAEQMKIVREMVEVPLQNPARFTQFGLRPPRGVLLYGPPGTGKTLIARAVAAETRAHVITVNGPEVISKYFGETEARLRDIFDEAAQKAPCIIFIDEIDALCPKRDSSASELEKRIVATLLTLMDGADVAKLANPSRVVVMGATNRPNSIDEALRRPGRFDREIEIGIPSAEARLEILTTLLRRVPHTLTDSEISQIAASTHGYVGADLAAVCREAGLKTIHRVTSDMLGLPSHVSDTEELCINADDVAAAMNEIRPSAMREIMLEVPKVLWSDIGGQEEVKQKLKEAVEWPLKHPEAFLRFNIRPPKGILLYGPPGCSKTLMAKALATEAGLNFIAVKGPELFSKWVGESERAVREVFHKARTASPSIVFFDEIDALAVRRGGEEASVADRVLSQLLSEMDGIEPLVNVTVVAATNRPDIIDSALLRPGRIDRILYVSPPDYRSRKEIFRIQIRRVACGIDVDADKLAKMTEGYSGAECVAICQEAAMGAMEENVEASEVHFRHFEKAIRSVTPRITDEMIQFYDRFRMQSGLRSV
ncbi:AAA family ATPase, CDC48 subfamily [Spizellomyces punctatus DAOM BR117]|uniref:AAA family ATPase, CDC48 subfamily n=1 Tax=Spizellomyces punctatus (strain DAOM BR117) TaxID=645134 RepID=A0A0L0HCT0_SPIPD|nr:AAA family ATPase, CDC48 subfamily [Spizellomyces punctatus DAOM BR117]KNC98972.1 AAA family ATPase, CDC48 subfamily [Spizellomyces punctatus DAOM BR117]|eukprot:XP_016607012.1 AAA family ATPase, CDC48 subfamily [Spizellomyces punctatus DAOM BR117]